MSAVLCNLSERAPNRLHSVRAPELCLQPLLVEHIALSRLNDKQDLPNGAGCAPSLRQASCQPLQRVVRWQRSERI